MPLASLLFLAPTAIASTDVAPASPENGKILIGIERAFGWSAYTASDDRMYGETLLYARSGDGFRAPWTWREPPGAYAYRAPRIAVDAVRGKLTFGGSFMVFAPHGEPKDHNDTIQSLSVDATVVGFGARAGYLVCGRSRFCFWGKAGLNLSWIDATEHLNGVNPTFGGGPLVIERTTKIRIRMLAISFEPTLLVGVAPHVALMVAPVLDWPLFGGASYESEGAIESGGGRVLNAGVNLGLTAWF